jgi:hypothetical protein
MPYTIPMIKGDKGMTKNPDLADILRQVDDAEELQDNPGQYFAAQRAAYKALREWATANPQELVTAAGQIPRYLLESKAVLDRKDLVVKPSPRSHVSDPQSHYNRALRMED